MESSRASAHTKLLNSWAGCPGLWPPALSIAVLGSWVPQVESEPFASSPAAPVRGGHPALYIPSVLRLGLAPASVALLKCWQTRATVPRGSARTTGKTEGPWLAASLHVQGVPRCPGSTGPGRTLCLYGGSLEEDGVCGCGAAGPVGAAEGRLDTVGAPRRLGPAELVRGFCSPTPCCPLCPHPFVQLSWHSRAGNGPCKCCF